MSQAGVLNIGSSTPTIPTSFDTDDGIATPAANVINIEGNDTTANNANGITTTGSGNTVTVLLTNRLHGTGTSAAGATSDLITFALSTVPATTFVYRFTFYISGKSTAGVAAGSGMGYTVFATAKTDGSASSIVKTIFSDSDEDNPLSAALIDVVASGNSIILRATGVVTETISYSAVGEYVVV